MLVAAFEVTVTTTRASLASLITGLTLTIPSESRYCLTFQSDDGASENGNTGIVAVGGSAVTVTGTAKTNGMIVRPNIAAVVSDSETGDVYLIASASTKVRVLVENLRS